MPVDILFDFVAIHLNGPGAAAADLRMNLVFTDLEDTWTVWVRRGVLNARNHASPAATLTVSGPKLALVAALLQPGAGRQLGADGAIRLDGDPAVLDALGEMLDQFDPAFPIVTP
jgi:alkyl sulfatase BDS1-like metallo-beta-lactamase superfamily hydrolase